jgi:hypothetical protein
LDANVQEALEHLEERIPRERYELIKAVCESYDYLVELARDENMTTDRLREIFCGSTYRADGGRGGHENGPADAAQRRAWRRRRRRRARSKKRRAAR